LTVVPVEKLTRERRRQQTRDVLIEAATEVFARRGYEGASLDEIAQTAGFTRGAIYKHFAGKEELFFAVSDGANQRVIESFRAIAPSDPDSREWDVARLGDLWRSSVLDVDDLLAIGMEYQLYVLRNPAARKRAAANMRRTRELVTAFIEEVAERTGMTLRLPAPTLAKVILAAADGLNYAARVDGEDLFAPFLELLNAGMVVPD
jgi:AcrR family transcriptional regulator